MNALSDLQATLDASRKSWVEPANASTQDFRFRICRSVFLATGTTTRVVWAWRLGMRLSIWLCCTRRGC